MYIGGCREVDQMIFKVLYKFNILSQERSTIYREHLIIHKPKFYANFARLLKVNYRNSPFPPTRVSYLEPL